MKEALESPLSSIVDTAEITTRKPSVALRPHLGCFWTLTTSSVAQVRTLPEGCAFLTFDPENTSSLTVFGPRSGPVHIEKLRGTLQGVRLRPGVLFSLLRIPANELVDRREPFSAFFGGDGRALEEQMVNSPSTESRYEILEQFLFRKLMPTHLDEKVLFVIRSIAASSGQIRIRDLETSCETTRRHLDRLFSRWVGVSPKRFARIIRFQALLRKAEDAPHNNLTQLALDHGYFDQAHMANEMAEFAGISPSQLFSPAWSDFSKTRCD